MEEGVAVVAEERQVESLLPFTLTGPPQETVPQSSRPTRETRSRRHTSPSTNDSAAAGGAWEGAGLLDSTRHSADSNPTEQELENNASDGVEDEDDAGKRRKTCINSTQSNGRLLDSNKDSLDGRQETTADSPRRQALRFEGDLYTPTWVRRDKAQKEGLCELCPPPGKWLLLKNSTFWYVSYTARSKTLL